MFGDKRIMVKKLQYEILDSERKNVLPKLTFLRSRFYLAGGTALALQIGHRSSIDFDFFNQTAFDNMRLFIELEETFDENKIEKIQDLKDTLSIIIDNSIKLSFFRIPYPVITPLIQSQYIRLLPVLEIGTMKLIALTRAAYRDYVDLYFILQQCSLYEIFTLARRKYKNFDEGIYLKCLLYYDDIAISPIQFTKGFNRDKKEIFSFIELKTNEYLRHN